MSESKAIVPPMVGSVNFFVPLRMLPSLYSVEWFVSVLVALKPNPYWFLDSGIDPETVTWSVKSLTPVKLLVPFKEA